MYRTKYKESKGGYTQSTSGRKDSTRGALVYMYYSLRMRPGDSTPTFVFDAWNSKKLTIVFTRKTWQK